MYLLNANFWKYFDTLIVPEEEQFKSVTMGSNHSVPSCLAKFLHRQQGNASIVLFRANLAPAVKIFLVLNRKALVGGDNVLCLKNQQSRVDRIDSIPNPIIIAVHIERKKIDLPGTTAFDQ